MTDSVGARMCVSAYLHRVPAATWTTLQHRESPRLIKRLRRDGRRGPRNDNFFAHIMLATKHVRIHRPGADYILTIYIHIHTYFYTRV